MILLSVLFSFSMWISLNRPNLNSSNSNLILLKLFIVIMIFLVFSVEQNYIDYVFRALPSYVLKTCKDGDHTTSLDNLFHSLISCWKSSLYPVWTSLVSAYVSCLPSPHHTPLWIARLHNLPMGPEGCSGWCYPQAVSYSGWRSPVPSASPAGECSSLWPAWWPSLGFAVVYQCLSCIGAAKTGHSIHMQASKCWAEADNPFPLYTDCVVVWYRPGYCWSALLPGHTAGLYPASCLPRPPGCFQQSCPPVSQYLACIITVGSFFPSAGLILVKFHKFPLGPFFQPV